MEVVICCIAKFENDYILEWAEYHLNLGFSRIYIYDNNEIDGERVQDVIYQERFDGKVFVENVRGKRYIQKEVYNIFYYTFDFDWCAFIDLDEFITFSEKSKYVNINDFIRERINYDVIHINWKCYGDNCQIRKKNGNVIDRFPIPIRPLDFKYNYNFPENNHIKSIIKKGLEINWNDNPHTPNGIFKICDEKGNRILENLPYKNYSHEILFIRHYYTKSIEEYTMKIIRQCADCQAQFYSYSKFYRINKFTISKFKIQSKLIKKYSIHGLNNSFSACFREYIKFNFIKRYKILYKLFTLVSPIRKKMLVK